MGLFINDALLYIYIYIDICTRWFGILVPKYEQIRFSLKLNSPEIARRFHFAIRFALLEMVKFHVIAKIASTHSVHSYILYWFWSTGFLSNHFLFVEYRIFRRSLECHLEHLSALLATFRLIGFFRYFFRILCFSMRSTAFSYYGWHF